MHVFWLRKNLRLNHSDRSIQMSMPINNICTASIRYLWSKQWNWYINNNDFINDDRTKGFFLYWMIFYSSFCVLLSFHVLTICMVSYLLLDKIKWIFFEKQSDVFLLQFMIKFRFLQKLNNLSFFSSTCICVNR